MLWIIFAAHYALGAVAYGATIKYFHDKHKAEDRRFFDLCNAILSALKDRPVCGKTLLDAWRYSWDLGNRYLEDIEEAARFLCEEGIIEKVDVGTRDPFLHTPLRIKK